MDTTKKFLYVNPDNTPGEFDTSRMFPVSSLTGMQEVDATSVQFAFKDQGQEDDTRVDVTVDSGKGKAYIKELVEAINFAKQSVIVLADASDQTSFSADVDFDSIPTVTVGGA